MRNGLLVAAALLLSLAGAAVMVWWAAARETATPVMPLSTSGTNGRALVVYHPGLSDFPDRITAAFGAGLAASGWRVDRTTASQQAPTDLAAYDLLVLASPVYANAAAPALSRYVDRAGDFGAKPVVLVFTAAGDAGPALQTGAAQVATRHGRVIGRFGYTTQRPNEPDPGDKRSNAERAVAMAREAGKALRVPAG